MDYAPATSTRSRNRRLSVDDEYRRVEMSTRQTMAKLNDLWDRVNMNDEMRISRVSRAFAHIEGLLKDMLASEEAMVATVEADIKMLLQKVMNLRHQLSLPQFTHNFPPNSIDLFKALEKEEKELHDLHDDKMSQQRELTDIMENLAFRLGEEVDDLVMEYQKKLMPESDRQILLARRLQMEGILKDRLQVATTWQTKLNKWIKLMGVGCGFDDDPNLRVILESNLRSEEFPLSQQTMESIEAYGRQLGSVYADWVQEKDFKWSEQYGRLTELYTNCHVADNDRMFSSVFDPERHTDRDFNEMGKEIIRLEALYGARQEVYELLKQWKANWQEKLSLEERKKDVSYYQSRERGHSLMKDAKTERNLNEVTLPRLKKLITEATAKYDADHPADRIVVEGMTAPKYVQWVMDEYAVEKDVERRNKLEHRKQELENSRMGAVFRTPQGIRKNFGRTPASCSRIGPEPDAKRRHMDSTISPGFFGHSASSSNLLSIISPIKTINKNGPKHSSPKSKCSSTSSQKQATYPSSPASAIRRPPLSKRQN